MKPTGRLLRSLLAVQQHAARQEDFPVANQVAGGGCQRGQGRQGLLGLGVAGGQTVPVAGQAGGGAGPAAVAQEVAQALEQEGVQALAQAARGRGGREKAQEESAPLTLQLRPASPCKMRGVQQRGRGDLKTGQLAGAALGRLGAGKACEQVGGGSAGASREKGSGEPSAGALAEVEARGLQAALALADVEARGLRAGLALRAAA